MWFRDRSGGIVNGYTVCGYLGFSRIVRWVYTFWGISALYDSLGAFLFHIYLLPHVVFEQPGFPSCHISCSTVLVFRGLRNDRVLVLRNPVLHFRCVILLVHIGW